MEKKPELHSVLFLDDSAYTCVKLNGIIPIESSPTPNKEGRLIKKDPLEEICLGIKKAYRKNTKKDVTFTIIRHKSRGNQGESYTEIKFFLNAISKSIRDTKDGIKQFKRQSMESGFHMARRCIQNWAYIDDHYPNWP